MSGRHHTQGPEDRDRPRCHVSHNLLTVISGYVRKYLDVKAQNFMRDFDLFCAQFSYLYHTQKSRRKIAINI